VAILSDLISSAGVDHATEGVGANSWYAEVVAPVPVSISDPLYVTIPELNIMSETKWGPCKWIGTKPPALGEECLVTFDNRQQLWAILPLADDGTLVVPYLISNSGAEFHTDSAGSGDETIKMIDAVSGKVVYLRARNGGGWEQVNNAFSATVLSSDDNGTVYIRVPGSGLRVAEGSNAKQGVAQLSGGTVVVSNTSVTLSSRIMLTPQDDSTTGAVRVSARTAGVSFTIKSSVGTDSGKVAYQIFEPA
jgi:hypothetical protein